jgi:hypothetical protein
MSFRQGTIPVNNHTQDWRSADGLPHPQNSQYRYLLYMKTQQYFHPEKWKDIEARKRFLRMPSRLTKPEIEEKSVSYSIKVMVNMQI